MGPGHLLDLDARKTSLRGPWSVPFFYVLQSARGAKAAQTLSPSDVAADEIGPLQHDPLHLRLSKHKRFNTQLHGAMLGHR